MYSFRLPSWIIHLFFRRVGEGKEKGGGGRGGRCGEGGGGKGEGGKGKGGGAVCS